MSVILNEAALTLLLDTEEGPVGQRVQAIAQTVVAAAQENVRDYFSGAPSLTVDQDIGFDMEGSTAIIGIQDAGNKSERLAQYQADGRVNWLTGALNATAV